MRSNGGSTVPAIEPGALRVAVRGWFAWAPGRETRAAWRAWAGNGAGNGAGQADDGDALPVLPMMLRRRATPLGQKMIGCALACGEAARTARYVLASRHAELARTVGILDAMTAGELPSPAEFSMAVHHGLAGLLSIHTGNRAGHTALSAGHDSFGFGLMEAAACLADNPAEPALLMHGDEPMPGPYADFADDDEPGLPLAFALALGPAGGGGEEIVFTATPIATPAATPTQGDAPPERAAALEFLRFLLSGAPAGEVRGSRMLWGWHRA